MRKRKKTKKKMNRKQIASTGGWGRALALSPERRHEIALMGGIARRNSLLAAKANTPQLVAEQPEAE